MKTILVAITTHKRPKWCLELIKELHSQREGFDIKIVIFCDKDETDYTIVKDFCREFNYTYLETRVLMGKYRFWEIINLTYYYADNQDYDYWISLPDDCIPVQNFFSRAINLLSEKYPVVNFFTMNIHTRMGATDKRVTVNDSVLMLTNWVDGCYISTKEIVQGLKIPIPIASSMKLERVGTGVSHEQVRYFNDKGILVAQSYYALVEHIGSLKSVMHTAKVRGEHYGKTLEFDLSSSLTEDDYNYTHDKLKQYN